MWEIAHPDPINDHLAITHYQIPKKFHDYKKI